MTTIGYIRVSTDEQDLAKQRHLLLEYSQKHKLLIDEFIEVEISSRKNQHERRITELIEKLNAGDVLLVAELSRLGRNMLETLNIINALTQKGVKIIFIRQPELSTTGPHTQLLLAIYSYFAESEREFISIRTKQGLAAAKAQGKQLVRETAIADIQEDIVKAERGVEISDMQAQARIKQANGEAEATHLKAIGEARGVKAIGEAKASAYRAGAQAMAVQGFTAVQLMQIVGEEGVRIIPDIMVNGGGENGRGGVVEALLSVILNEQLRSREQPATNGTKKEIKPVSDNPV